MRTSLAIILAGALVGVVGVMTPGAMRAADLTTSAAGGSAVPPPPADVPADTGQDNAAKARALVAAAINMTDSNRAVGLLWQATELDPTFEEAYVYLGLYYNSRSQFDRVVQVYQKLVKYHPNETSAWLNIGEAYMSFSPPRYDAALPYYRKAYELDPHSAMAALRMGEIMATEGDRDQAIRYLHQAAANPTYAEEARKILTQMGAS